MGKALEAALRFSPEAKNWVGDGLAGQAVVVAEKITEKKPHGEIVGGRYPPRDLWGQAKCSTGLGHNRSPHHMEGFPVRSRLSRQQKPAKWSSTFSWRVPPTGVRTDEATPLRTPPPEHGSYSLTRRTTMKTFTTRNLVSPLPAGALAAIVSLAAAFPATAQVPPSGWQQIGQPITLESHVSGAGDLANWQLAVPRSGSRMYLNVSLLVYKTASPINGFDYYLVTGRQRHAVTGFAQNAVSRGYYGRQMSLALIGSGANLIDFGPNSTVGSETTSWTVGASVGAKVEGDNVSPTGSASFSFGKSFSSPDVRFKTSSTASAVTFTTRLPGHPDAPKPPSRAGYGFDLAAIFEVPAGQGLQLTIGAGAAWRYDYTLLIENDIKEAVQVGIFNVDFQNRPLANGNGRCLTAAGIQPVTQTCDSHSALQKWSYTPGGQVRNDLTQSCLDVDPSSSNGMILAACDPNSATQRYSLGSSGFGSLPGMRNPQGFVVRAQQAIGSPVQRQVPSPIFDVLGLWTVR